MSLLDHLMPISKHEVYKKLRYMQIMTSQVMTNRSSDERMRKIYAMLSAARRAGLSPKMLQQIEKHYLGDISRERAYAEDYRRNWDPDRWGLHVLRPRTWLDERDQIVDSLNLRGWVA